MILPKNSSFKISVGIRNATDFSPFGVELKGRNFEVVGGGNYRFGFNGMEADNDVKGEGNSYTTEFRQLDSRLGRWYSIDPKPEAGVSPYCSMDNNPIKYNDVLGLYTEKRAKRMAEKAEKHGYTAIVNDNGTAGKNDWVVSVGRENDDKTGYYSRDLIRGRFHRFEQKDFYLYKEHCQAINALTGQPLILEGISSKDKLNIANGLSGLAGDIAKESSSSFRLTNGNVKGQISPKVYSPAWGGGSTAQIKTYNVSKIGAKLSGTASVFGTGLAYYDIATENTTPMTLPDAAVGTVGSAAYFAEVLYGIETPVVGEAVAIYGAMRITYDVFHALGSSYGPSTWYGKNDFKYFE